MPNPTAFAATRPINPPGAEPVLTEQQVWKALQIKARKPQQFVPMISECKVVEDEGNKVTREVKFAKGPDAPVVTEEIEAYPSASVYFEMSSGVRVLNILSRGPPPTHELLLTYSFGNGIPGVKPDDAELSSEQLNERIGGGVEHSIAVMRKMAKEGLLD